MADRIRTTLYWTTHPHLPWLTADANPAHQHAQSLQSTLAPYPQTWTTNGFTDTLIIQDKHP